MINLVAGTNSLWLSCKETLPVGTTPSYYTFTFTNSMRGETVSFNTPDLDVTNKWGVFSVVLDTPQNLSASTVDLTPGLYTYQITASGSTVILETGNLTVTEWAQRTVLERPAKNVRVLKR